MLRADAQLLRRGGAGGGHGGLVAGAGGAKAVAGGAALLGHGVLEDLVQRGDHHLVVLWQPEERGEGSRHGEARSAGKGCTSRLPGGALESAKGVGEGAHPTPRRQPQGSVPSVPSVPSSGWRAHRARSGGQLLLSQCNFQRGQALSQVVGAGASGRGAGAAAPLRGKLRAAGSAGQGRGCCSTRGQSTLGVGPSCARHHWAHRAGGVQQTRTAGNSVGHAGASQQRLSAQARASPSSSSLTCPLGSLPPLWPSAFEA